MALAHFASIAQGRRGFAGLAFAWWGFAIMWLFWTCFVVFLASPNWAPKHWPLPTADGESGIDSHAAAAVIDLFLISLFGLQHSLMARPWFKQHIAGLPPAFERCTFVHAANTVLFALIIFWQPIPVELWNVGSPWRELAWAAFAAGWVILLLGALSFGILDLLGIEQMRAWARGVPPPPSRLKIGRLYRWLRHPMYVGVLLAIWSTPRMTVGHLLLACGMSLYVLIAMRYEERDLFARFGDRYIAWRGQ